jgi:protein O-mannosyl-transferase
MTLGQIFHHPNIEVARKSFRHFIIDYIEHLWCHRTTVAKKECIHRERIPAPKSKDGIIPAGVCRQNLVVGVFLVLLVVAVFGQTARFGFVNYDDDAYVCDNLVVKKGLTLKGAAWALTYGEIGHWHPLTWLTHMADCQAYGLWAGGHHLTNVALHAVTSVLLFLILRSMTGKLWRSAFVAAVFAIHPLRVESVAWIAERKDVLSGMFFMLALWAYVGYVRQPSRGRYVAMALLYGLGLLSKNMLVTLPFVLLLLDWWPLGRMKPAKAEDGKAEAGNPEVPIWGLVKEKIPLLLLSVGSWVATALAPEKVEALYRVPFLERVGNALVSYVIYLRQTVFPAGLAASYPNAPNGQPIWKVSLAFVVLAGVSAGVVTCRKKRPFLLMGWLWYLGMLVPAIGIVQISYYAHADRYTYLPGIGLAIAVTWAVADWSVGWKHQRVVLGGLMAALAGVLIVCGHIQTSYWKNSESLWIRALACAPANCVAHNNLGNALVKDSKLDDAIEQYHKAIENNPAYDMAHYNLGDALVMKGDMEEAIAQYRKALEINPFYEDAHYNLGNALALKGDLEEAIAQYRKALEFGPGSAETHNNLGKALALKGDLEEAIVQYQKALAIQPNFTTALNNLAWLLATASDASLRNGAKAVALAEQVKQLTGGGNPMVLHTLAAAYAETGHYSEAAETARRALQLADAQGGTALAGTLQREIKLYEAGTPVRDVNP